MNRFLSALLLLSSLAHAEDSWDFNSKDKSEAVVKAKSDPDAKVFLAQGSSGSDDSVMSAQFSSWSARFGTGDKPSFKKTMSTIYKVNSDPSIPYVLTANQFSAMSPAQLKSTYLMSDQFANIKSSAPVSEATLGRRSLLAAPATLDWRSQGMVPPVKNQGGCGSCWAFAATGAIETMYRIKVGGANSPISLSEQQLVSCCNSANGCYSGGCNGGGSNDAINYVFRNNMTTTAIYPYTARTGSCSDVVKTTVSGQTVKPSTASIQVISGDPVAALMNALTIGPVTVYFNVISQFFSYSSGVYDPAAECTPSSRTINHAMLLVGYNSTAPIPYWIVRNSWGAGWGSQGYVNIKMVPASSWPYGPCGMYQASYQVSQSFVQTLGNPVSPTASSPPPPRPPPRPPSPKLSPPPFSPPRPPLSPRLSPPPRPPPRRNNRGNGK